jgi:hypothetical protein
LKPVLGGLIENASEGKTLLNDIRFGYYFGRDDAKDSVHPCFASGVKTPSVLDEFAGYSELRVAW